MHPKCIIANASNMVDFILCIYEVAYSDENLHFMEQYLIRKIAHSLHVEHNDLIEAKIEIKKYL